MSEIEVTTERIRRMEDNFEAAITRMEAAMLAMSNNIGEKEEERAPATVPRRWWTGQQE